MTLYFNEKDNNENTIPQKQAKNVVWINYLLFGRKKNYQNKCHYVKHVLQKQSSRPEVFLAKGVLKICSRSTWEYPCWSVISIKLLCSFIEITLRHGCSPANMLHLFRNLFLRTSLDGCFCSCIKETSQYSPIGYLSYSYYLFKVC